MFQLNISSAMSCLYCYCYCNFLEITQQGFNIVRFKFNFTSEACSLPNFISVDFNLLENEFRRGKRKGKCFFISFQKKGSQYGQIHPFHSIDLLARLDSCTNVWFHTFLTMEFLTIPFIFGLKNVFFLKVNVTTSNFERKAWKFVFLRTTPWWSLLSLMWQSMPGPGSGRASTLASSAAWRSRAAGARTWPTRERSTWRSALRSSGMRKRRGSGWRSDQWTHSCLKSMWLGAGRPGTSGELKEAFSKLVDNFQAVHSVGEALLEFKKQFYGNQHTKENNWCTCSVLLENIYLNFLASETPNSIERTKKVMEIIWPK